MDVTNSDILYGISALCIVLGFIALLKHKQYIDPNTRKPSVVELPFFGKLKTNYPALVFVFIGGGLALEAIRESPSKEDWKVTGSLIDPQGKHVKWSQGNFTLIPHAMTWIISDAGTFDLAFQLEKGQSIQTYDTLNYTTVQGTEEFLTDIDLRKEYQAFMKGEDSLIKDIKATHWSFNPIRVTTKDLPP